MNEELARLWPRAERILDEVLELPEPERTSRALASCGGDPALERAVRDLLRADSQPTAFLDRLPEALFDGAADAPPPIERIGPFRIAGELGSGGMGTVLLGERDDGTFEQRVAIKLIHRGLGTADARETLVRERRILARLEHPDIARMYDGGVTSDGDPYFVMENVDGVRIDAYCRERGLSLAARLRLFARVCRAVEYAHGRFVVHCDLKPGNILVTPAGDPKLVDFGIAHLLEGEPRGATPTEARGMTPAYAAPEQERGEPATAATDVYQLGIVLREILTDARGPAAEAALRRLPADLAAAVGKALRLAPADRYPTVETFRRDLEAFLQHRPVSAHPATPGYLLGKFAARHRVQVAAAAAVVTALLAGLIGVASQSRVAAAERDRARNAERRASAVNEFVLQELLRAPMPEASLGRNLTVAEVLGNAARSVGHAFDGEPRTEAEVRLALARTYAALGRADEAATHAEAARDLLARDRATPQASLLAAERTIADIEYAKGDYPRARVLLEDLHARDADRLGAGHPETLQAAASLGRVLSAVGEFARAEAVLRDAREIAAREHPGLWRLSLDLGGPLARALSRRNENVEAERIAREMLSVLEDHVGPDHPERVTTLGLLAETLVGQFRYVDAEAVAVEAVSDSRRIFGAEHPATAEALYTHALTLERLGRYPGAIAAVEEAVSAARKTLGPDHPKTLFFTLGKAILVRNSGDPSRAESLVREVVDGRARVLGEANPDTIAALRSLNVLLLALGRDDEARSVAERAVRAFDEAAVDAGADPNVVDGFAEFLLTVRPEAVRDPRKALTLAERAVAATGRQAYPQLRTLGDALDALGRKPEAIAAMREALALPDGIRSWSTEERVVELLRETGTPRDVESFLEERIAAQRAHPGADERMIGKSVRLLALHFQGERRLDEAESRFAEAEEIFRRVLPGDNWELGRIVSEHGGCLAARGDAARAEALLVEGVRILEKDPLAKRASAEARKRLAELREEAGRPSP